MKHLISSLTIITWALWFGGGVALMIFVQRLFRYDRSVAVVAAPQLFLLFERYQLVLAAIAVPCAVGWRMRMRSASSSAFAGLLIVCMAIAIASATWITPSIERLRVTGQSGSPEFRHLHGVSMLVYLTEFALLLIAGTCIPAIVSKRPELY